MSTHPYERHPVSRGLRLHEFAINRSDLYSGDTETDQDPDYIAPPAQQVELNCPPLP